MTSKIDNPSLTPDALRDLSDEQTERLTAILDDYLARLEAGESPDLQELLAKNSDIQAPLKLYIGKLGDLHNFAAGFSPHLSGSIDDEQDSSDTFEPVPAPKPLVSDDTDVKPDGSTSPPASESAQPLAANDSAQRVPTRVLSGEIDPEESPTVRKLGDFELLRVIGRGGMGIVYEAQQLSLRRRVALKLLPLISVLDARQIARFKNEAQAAANLQHPNIVPVHAVGNYQGVHYYAMRFIDGHPLDAIIAALRHKKSLAAPTASGTKAHIKDANASQSNVEADAEEKFEAAVDHSAADDWTIPPAYQRVVRLGIEAASALAAAHSDGIIHRDIKPSNLMLDKKGKLWITDFGLARRITDHSLTATGDVMGTLRYMSPEQSKGQTALVDGRSDVYSLGATLYELLALEPAMTGESSPAMLRAIEQQMPISLKQHRPDLPRDLVTVIEKAMAKDREERYLTAQDFADDLTRVLEGRPTLAKPPTLLERGIKWVQRNQRLARLELGLCAAALIFFAAGLTVILKARNERQAAEREARQRVDELRSQSDAYFFMVKDLEGIPGTEDIRKRVYTRLLNDFRGFVSSVRSEEKTPAELAIALLHMGDLQREMQDWSAAHDSLTEAEKMLRQQAIAHPSRLEHRRNLANCLTLLGLVELQQGDTDSAEKQLTQSTRVLSELIQLDGESSGLRHDRAKAANSLAIVWMRTDKKSAAAELLSQTKVELEQEIARWPENSDLKELLFAVCNNLAGVLAPTDPSRATELYAIAVDMQTQVCQVDNRLRPSADLAVAYTNLGRARSRQRQFEAARAAYTKANEISDLVRQLVPSNFNYMRDHSINLNNLGMAEQQTGDLQSAELRFRDAIAIQEKLCAEIPNSASLQHELGGTYNNLANLLEKRSQGNDVDENYRLAIDYQSAALRAAPALTEYRDFLDNHLLNYSRWLTETNRYDLALETVKQRQELWPANHPHQLIIARQLADAAFGLAADSRKRVEAVRFGQAAKQALELAQDAGLSVQSVLKQDSFSSLAKLKSLTESASP